MSRLKGKINSDEFIYYMSLAVGEDLYPWFRDIGTTVTPRYMGLPPARGLWDRQPILFCGLGNRNDRSIGKKLSSSRRICRFYTHRIMEAAR